jgi:NYN domain
VAARVVVFLDWQNIYNSARESFCAWQARHWQGQVDPVALAEYLAQDSPFDRELQQVRIYRGQPDGKLDPRGYGASRRQHAVWQQSSLVTLVTRPLRYPKGWPTRHRVGERPQEKGIDVALALDFAIMGIRREYTAEPGSRDEETLKLLGSWAATREKAEAIRAAADLAERSTDTDARATQA